MADGAEPIGGRITEFQVELALHQPGPQPLHLKGHDLAQFALVEAAEDDAIVQSVQEFRSELGLQRLVHPFFHGCVLLWISGQLQNRLAADVAGEDQHGVGEIHGASLTVGDAPVVEDLQHHVEHIGVGLLHLVEQDHGVGPAPHRFGELPTGFVADVAGRCADQPAHGVLLHVLRHVDAHHGLIAVEQAVGQCFGQLRFAHTGRSEEQEAGDGAVGIAQTGSGTLDGIGDGSHRLVLADHPLVKIILQLQQFLHLALHQPGHRDPGPFGDHLGNVVFADFFSQQALVGTVLLGDPRLLLLELLLETGEGAVFQFSSFVEVVVALGLFHLQLHPFDLLLEAGEIVDRPFLLLPLGIEAALLFAQFRQFPFDPLQAFLTGAVGFAAERQFLHLQLQDLAIDLIDLLRLGGDFHLQSSR